MFDFELEILVPELKKSSQWSKPELSSNKASKIVKVSSGQLKSNSQQSEPIMSTRKKTNFQGGQEEIFNFDELPDFGAIEFLSSKTGKSVFDFCSTCKISGHSVFNCPDGLPKNLSPKLLSPKEKIPEFLE
jgi:hypothetical protein